MVVAFWAITAGLLYAVLLVAVEVKFSQYSPQVLQVCFYPIMFAITVTWLVSRKNMGFTNTFPPPTLIVLGVFIGILYYFADVALLKALTSSSNATAVAVLLAMSPALTALVRYIWVGGHPNRYHVAAFILVLAVVILATKAELVANVQQPPVVTQS